MVASKGWRENGLARHAFALASVMAAIGARALLQPVLGNQAPFATFFLAVLATCYFCGRAAAVTATVAGAVAAIYLFFWPRYSFALSLSQWLWAALYLLICLVSIATIEQQRKTAGLALERLRELESEHARRETAEREAGEQRRWASQALSSIGDAVLTTDANGYITFLNSVAEQLSGWTLADAAGQPLQRVFHIVNESTRTPVAGPLARILSEGAVVGLANHTALVRKDGSLLPIDDSGAPIRDENGTVRGAVIVFRDYTERRRAEETGTRLAAIVQYSHEAIVSKSLDSIVQTWNPAAEKLFGYTAEEAVGRSITFLSPPGKEHEESAILETIRSGGVIDRLETVRRRKDGVDVQVSLSISPLFDSHGEIIGVSHIARDITTQKELHQQLLQAQKLESLGVLAGGVAHDFNNLLTGILGSSSLLTEMLPDGSMEASIANQITLAGDRAAHLTRQLLAYAGKGRFLVEQIDVGASIREIVDLVKASIPRNTGVELRVGDGTPRIEADVAQFQQLVMNLVINAAEAMESKGGAVRIDTAATLLSTRDIEQRAELADLEPGEYVVISVSDTGSGMDPATLSRIFDPFFSTKFTGRGLGLAAARGIVQGHRGAILVDTAPAEGSIFQVFLPAATKRATGNSQARPPSRPVVLVVDDEEVVRETARLTLERNGYGVVTAIDGGSALDLLSRDGNSIALVLLDLSMPVVAGRTALDRIRGWHPNLPVIVCSGFEEAEALSQIRDGSVTAFLKKPFTAEALRTRVASVLQLAGTAGA